MLTCADFAEDRYVAVGEALFEREGFVGTFNPAHFAGRWYTLLDTGIGAAWGWFEEGDLCGALGAVIIQELNTGDVLAQEAFWFTRPDKRGSIQGMKLFGQFERWAREIEADRIIAVYRPQSMPEGIPMFYVEHGFQPLEQVFLKSL